MKPPVFISLSAEPPALAKVYYDLLYACCVDQAYPSNQLRSVMTMCMSTFILYLTQIFAFWLFLGLVPSFSWLFLPGRDYKGKQMWQHATRVHAVLEYIYWYSQCYVTHLWILSQSFNYSVPSKYQGIKWSNSEFGKHAPLRVQYTNFTVQNSLN